jgi:hypothetical protein
VWAHVAGGMRRDEGGDRRSWTDGGRRPPGRDEGNVFLVTVDENFERTVAAPADLDGQPGRPDGIAADATEARLWGAAVTSRNRKTFERMAPGDVLLFYRDGEYVGVGEVGETFEDTAGWVAETFWDREATLVYTVERFHSVSVPRGPVNGLFDYDAGYTPPGFMRVADDRVRSPPQAIALAVTRYDERNG